MRSLEDTRRYEVLVDTVWVLVHWEQLDVGDRVRQFDPHVTDRWLEFTVDRHPSLLADDLFDTAVGNPASEHIDHRISPVPQDEPTGDGTDLAHPAYWRGHDDAINGICARIMDILDGHDTGLGSSNGPWGKVRQRLVDLVKTHEFDD